jgi:hypothetical protein
MGRLRILLLFTLIAVGDRARADCLDALDAQKVPYRPAGPIPGVDDPVEVTGPLGGVTYVALGRARPLVLDCSLVYSLALAGRYLRDEGITTARFSDAIHRRYVRGTTRWSKHSHGLALDVHRFDGATPLSVDDDYQTGLGRGRDCVGQPGDDRARRLRVLWCRLARSELFRLVLDPDFDEDHRNHFHLQAEPWTARKDLGWREEPSIPKWGAYGGSDRAGRRAAKRLPPL